MVYLKIFTWCWEQTLFIWTRSLGQLLLTCWRSEICCWTTNIMDIPLKFWILCNNLCFINNRFMTSCLNNTTLMEGQCTKTTSTKTSTITNQRKLYLSNSRNSACFFIAWMISSHIWKCIHSIHFFLR